jgi:transcriptional regulator with XRE-family HTH domain
MSYRYLPLNYKIMVIPHQHWTVAEWERHVGDQIRTLRVASDLDQAGLAALADVSVGALSNLERGKGSSLKTVVAVLRALGRTDWLEALAPSVTVSPIAMLRAKQRGGRTRVRVRARNPRLRRASP